MTASAVLLVAGAGILGVSYWPRGHPAGAVTAVPGTECRMTPIPPPAETADAIESIGTGIADDIRRYGVADLPAGVTREQLASEARTRIDQQRQRLDELVADGLDVIAGKTEAPHTTFIMLRRCG
jgi:hypothetical protein